MAARAQVYRLQRQDEAVTRAMQRVSDARSKVAKLETDKSNKALEIQQVRAAMMSHSNTSNDQQGFEEVILPSLKSQLELLHKQGGRLYSPSSRRWAVFPGMSLEIYSYRNATIGSTLV